MKWFKENTKYWNVTEFYAFFVMLFLTVAFAVGFVLACIDRSLIGGVGMLGCFS